MQSERMWPLTNYGAAVNVAAPAGGVPVVSATGGYSIGVGTSFAAPMVTSLAAILKSINPSLSPQQIKQSIVNHAVPMADNTDFGRVVFPISICQALLDANVGDPVKSWIDPTGVGSASVSGLILSRMCPTGMSFSVDGYGRHEAATVDSELGGLIEGSGVLTGWAFSGANDLAYLRLATTGGSEFALGTHIILSSSVEGDAGVTATFKDRESADVGTGVSGSIIFDSCRIDDREPFAGINAWVIQASGAFEGVVEVAHTDGRPQSLHWFSGYFSLPLIVSPGANEEDAQYLEHHCAGGTAQPSSGP